MIKMVHFLLLSVTWLNKKNSVSECYVKFTVPSLKSLFYMPYSL